MKIPNIFKERNPTQGSLVKISIFMTIPLWLNTILWMIINSLNLFWVSGLGEAAIVAVAIGSTAFTILMVPTQGIGIATYNLIGGFNRDDRAGLDKLVKQVLAITWLASFALAIFGYFVGPVLLRLLGAESEVLSSAAAYLRISSLGGLISFSFWPLLKMVRSTRDMFRPMLFMGLVLALDGVFDYLFILGNLGFPKLGVTGAALSSVFSAVIGTALVIWMLARGKMFLRVNFRDWRGFKLTFKTLRALFWISGFDTLEGLIRTAVVMINFGIVAFFGTVAIAAFSIGQRFFKYASQFCSDIGETTAIVFSNNLRDLKRAEKSSWVNSIISAIILGAIGLIFFIFAGRIVGLFTKNPEVLAAGIAYLKITTLAGIGYIFFTVGSILRKSFVGAGDTLTPLLVFLAMIVLQTGLAITLPKYFGLGINGVWLALLAGMIFYGSALSTLFKIRFRKKY